MNDEKSVEPNDWFNDKPKVLNETINERLTRFQICKEFAEKQAALEKDMKGLGFTPEEIELEMRYVGHPITREGLLEACKDVECIGFQARSSIKLSEYDIEKILHPKWVFGVEDDREDKGCPLLDDLDKLCCNLGKVFPQYRSLDRNYILKELKEKFPRRSIYWKWDNTLTIDEAVTEIHLSDLRPAFYALTKVVSGDCADKIMTAIVVKKVKKLF